jgi:hypothetical protein
LRAKAATHDNDTFRKLREVRVDRYGESDVGQRTSRIDRHIMRMGVNLSNQEMSGIFGRVLDTRVSFNQFGHHVGTMGWLPIRAPRDKMLPNSVIGKAPIKRLLQLRLLLRANQWKDGTGNNRDIGPVDQFEHAQRVLNLFRLPCITGDHCDSQHVDLCRLQQQHHRHLISASGTCAILIDDDHASGLRASGHTTQKDEKQGTG